MRPLRPQPSLRRSQLQLGDRQTSLRAQSVSESKEGADNADPPPRPGPVPLEALPPLGGNTGPDTPSNLVVGDWTPREHINLAKTGPLTVSAVAMGKGNRSDVLTQSTLEAKTETSTSYHVYIIRLDRDHLSRGRRAHLLSALQGRRSFYLPLLIHASQVRVYRMEQVCNPAGISELPMPRVRHV